MADEFDALAYHFWSLHPRDIPIFVDMPSGYPGGRRAWLYATVMRLKFQKAIEAQAAELAAAKAEVARLVDAAENVLIAYAMGWDMDGVMDNLDAVAKPHIAMLDDTAASGGKSGGSDDTPST